MRSFARSALALAMAIGLAQPAYAAGNAPVPEPGMLGLLAMAVTGVVVGRRLACKKPPKE